MCPKGMFWVWFFFSFFHLGSTVVRLHPCRNTLTFVEMGMRARPWANLCSSQKKWGKSKLWVRKDCVLVFEWVWMFLFTSRYSPLQPPHIRKYLMKTVTSFISTTGLWGKLSTVHTYAGRCGGFSAIGAAACCRSVMCARQLGLCLFAVFKLTSAQYLPEITREYTHREMMPSLISLSFPPVCMCF